MERIEYEKLDQLEDVVWWFVGLHANLKAAFERCGTPKDGGVVLDAGCGTGGLLGYLARHLPAFSVVGVDVDEMACKMARAKSFDQQWHETQSECDQANASDQSQEGDRDKNGRIPKGL